MTNKFRLTNVLKINDIEQFTDIAKKIIAEIESEVGTLAFQMYLDEQNSKCVIYEQFADSDAWITHANSNAAKVLLPELLKHSNIERFEVLGDVSEEAKKTMDGLGATYLKRKMGFEK
jgi:quinol monooxygenase YgiN